MRVNKEQAIQMITMQAKNIERETGCTGQQAIEMATIQVDKMIRSFTKNNLTLAKVLGK